MSHVWFVRHPTNASDDRLKDNESIIENACETLSKLRPQLYDKKSQIWRTMTLQLGIKKSSVLVLLASTFMGS